MPIADKIEKYYVSVDQNNYENWFRQINLRLESGGTAYIGFPKQRPADWLQFFGSATNLFMTQDEFADVYHILQSENPVYFTALNIEGLQVGLVHTENFLAENHTEELYAGQKLSELIRQARSQEVLVTTP